MSGGDIHLDRQQVPASLIMLYAGQELAKYSPQQLGPDGAENWNLLIAGRHPMVISALGNHSALSR